MIKIAHRVNTIEELIKVPTRYGVEIDLRAFGEKVILNHEPFEMGQTLDEYLLNFRHRFIIFNIKEAGIESEVLKIASRFGIKDFFLLDVEFSYLYRAAREGIRKIAVRFSEDESIENAQKYKGMVDWVWIDTNTRLPLSKNIINRLTGFKTCLVSPDRWGRPEDIEKYKNQMKSLNFRPEAVMSSLDLLQKWD